MRGHDGEGKRQRGLNSTLLTWHLSLYNDKFPRAWDILRLRRHRKLGLSDLAK